MIGNKQTILITGINGFLGSCLAKVLSDNYDIIGLEYSSNNLFRLLGCNYKMYFIDNGFPDNIFSENSIDVIIHTATFYGRQNEALRTIANANLFSPIHLLGKAIEEKCPLFINTDSVLDRFVSTYALTKNQFREWLFLKRNDIKVVNMQLEHFYGPGCSNTNFIIAMIEKLQNNVPSIDLTLGEQKRYFVYIDDVVNAFKTVLNNISLVEETFTTFQVANNNLESLKYLMLLIKELTKSKTILNFGALPYRENELMRSIADNSKLKEIGWESHYTIKKGLLKTIIHKSKS